MWNKMGKMAYSSDSLTEPIPAMSSKNCCSLDRHGSFFLSRNTEQKASVIGHAAANDLALQMPKGLMRGALFALPLRRPQIAHKPRF